jgi:hypothetical protein
MKRAINEIIKTYLADQMLFGDLTEGGSVVVDFNAESGRFEFNISHNEHHVSPVAALPPSEMLRPALPEAA